MIPRKEGCSAGGAVWVECFFNFSSALDGEQRFGPFGEYVCKGMPKFFLTLKKYLPPAERAPPKMTKMNAAARPQLTAFWAGAADRAPMTGAEVRNF